ncbi:MAG: GntR family transcriptional regulator [Deltaproteobacteria bacterium]|nr:GntR family transcriptional regulator [Deltaproteobacteria bacterium]
MAKPQQKSIVPLYGRVAATIKNKIVTGQYEQGSKLASEENIAKEYSVSRITIRQAFAQLEQEEWISRQRGKGTFISKTHPAARQTDLSNFQDMVQMIAMSDLKPVSIKNLKVNQTRIANDIRKTFNLSGNDEIVRIRRIILKDNSPVHLIENFMSVELASHLSIEEIRQKKGIIRILNEKIDIQIGKGEMHMEAMAADQDISDIIGCQVMDPLMCLRIYIWFSSGRPFEIINNLFRADCIKYKIDLTTDELDLSSIQYP